MHNRKVRNFAVAAVTIFSAFFLAIVNAADASASTAPICSGGAPRDCIQIFGSGLNITEEDGWIWNNTSASIPSAHIEFYSAFHNQSPLAPGSAPFVNQGVGRVDPNSNSVAALIDPPQPNSDIYECDASWQDNGSQHILLGWACGYVHGIV